MTYMLVCIALALRNPEHGHEKRGIYPASASRMPTQFSRRLRMLMDTTGSFYGHNLVQRVTEQALW